MKDHYAPEKTCLHLSGYGGRWVLKGGGIKVGENNSGRGSECGNKKMPNTSDGRGTKAGVGWGALVEAAGFITGYPG